MILIAGLDLLVAAEVGAFAVVAAAIACRSKRILPL